MKKLINSLLRARMHKKKINNVLFKDLDLSLDEGYNCQKKLNNLLRLKGYGNQLGYKIGCTTNIMQKYLQIDHPCSGELFSNYIYSDTHNIKFNNFFKLGIECELAVKISKDIVTLDILKNNLILEFIESFHTSIEIVEDRFEDYHSTSTPILIADNFFNHSVIIGKPFTNWKNEDINNLKGTLYINNIIYKTGKTDMILGNPINALKWLVKHILSRNQIIKKKSIITLGSIIKTVWVENNYNEYKFSIDKLGSCKVKFH